MVSVDFIFTCWFVFRTVEKRENCQKRDSTDDEEGEEESQGEESTKKKKKRKRKQKDKQLLKKESKRLRTNVMSEGLDTIKFSSIVLNDNTDVEVETKNDFWVFIRCLSFLMKIYTIKRWMEAIIHSCVALLLCSHPYLDLKSASTTITWFFIFEMFYDVKLVSLVGKCW